MENRQLASPVSDTTTNPARTSPEAVALAEVQKGIATDCRLAPQEYLEEVRVAASGE